jgi:hypothetical protein
MDTISGWFKFFKSVLLPSRRVDTFAPSWWQIVAYNLSMALLINNNWRYPILYFRYDDMLV